MAHLKNFGHLHGDHFMLSEPILHVESCMCGPRVQIKGNSVVWKASAIPIPQGLC